MMPHKNPTRPLLVSRQQLQVASSWLEEVVLARTTALVWEVEAHFEQWYKNPKKEKPVSLLV